MSSVTERRYTVGSVCASWIVRSVPCPSASTFPRRGFVDPRRRRRARFPPWPVPSRGPGALPDSPAGFRPVTSSARRSAQRPRRLLPRVRGRGHGRLAESRSSWQRAAFCACCRSFPPERLGCGYLRRSTATSRRAAGGERVRSVARAAHAQGIVGQQFDSTFRPLVRDGGGSSCPWLQRHVSRSISCGGRLRGLERHVGGTRDRSRSEAGAAPAAGGEPASSVLVSWFDDQAHVIELQFEHAWCAGSTTTYDSRRAREVSPPPASCTTEPGAETVNQPYSEWQILASSPGRPAARRVVPSCDAHHRRLATGRLLLERVAVLGAMPVGAELCLPSDRPELTVVPICRHHFGSAAALRGGGLPPRACLDPREAPRLVATDLVVNAALPRRPAGGARRWQTRP